MTQRIYNHDIGYDSLPQNDLATSDGFVQFVNDNPDSIHRFFGQEIELNEGFFIVDIDSWMDVELVPQRPKREED
jgi:hypothetical protein